MQDLLTTLNIHIPFIFLEQQNWISWASEINKLSRSMQTWRGVNNTVLLLDGAWLQILKHTFIMLWQHAYMLKAWFREDSSWTPISCYFSLEKFQRVEKILMEKCPNKRSWHSNGRPMFTCFFLSGYLGQKLQLPNGRACGLVAQISTYFWLVARSLEVFFIFKKLIQVLMI